MPQSSLVATKQVTLTPGKYFAGYTGALEMPASLIIESLVREGFRNVTFGLRDIDKLPVTINPKGDTFYNDTWDGWLSADYVGNPRTTERPAIVNWFIKDASAPPVPAAAAAKTDWGKTALYAFLLWWAFS